MRKFLSTIIMLVMLTAVTSALNLNGTWVNENENTGGITKLVIRNGAGNIEAWGKCHPRDCDWGKVRFHHTAKGILASWRQPRIGHKVILAEKINNHRIRVTAKLLYCDSRHDKTKIYYFKKLTPTVSGVRKFTGGWRNSDPNTRGITRITITRKSGKPYIHAWGKCHPRDCDWGEVRARRNGNRLVADWDQGFVNRHMVIHGLDPNSNGKYQRLKMRLYNRYHDSRGNRQETYYFDRRW